MSPSVVTPDWYRPDNDARALRMEGGKKNDTQSSSRSAWPKVAFQVPHQHTSAIKHEKKQRASGLGFAGCQEKFLFLIILIIPSLAEQKNNNNKKQPSPCRLFAVHHIAVCQPGGGLVNCP